MIGLVALAVAAFVSLPPLAGQGSFNEREVKSQPSELDNPGVYAMDFRFKDPRVIKVKLPGQGERIVWYVWFQLINRTGKPQKVAPYFELVTLDSPGIYREKTSITAEDKVRKIEDPTGYLNIKNTVLIGSSEIPPSKPADEAFPRPVTGVAIWDAGPADPAKRNPKQKELSDSTRFSIFVSGISDGIVQVDAPAPGLPPITQYKTLQLNFKRKGDALSLDSRDFEFVPPPQWIYRSASRTITPAKKDNNK
jgi:hypothetical protein